MSRGSKTAVKKYNSMKDIIYQKINDEYSWGMYGEFKVVIMRKNGYINATKLCNEATTKNGKVKAFRLWKNNADSDELIEEVSSSVGIPTGDILVTPVNTPNIVRGTYAHPDLIPHIASWASKKFAVKVSKIVNNYLIKKAIQEKNREIKEKDDKIDKLTGKVDKLLANNKKLLTKNDKLLSNNEELLTKNNKMDKRLKRLLVKNDDLYDQNEEILTKVDIISNDRVVPTNNSANNHLLVIIKNHDDPEEYDENDIIYQYHALRVMRKSYPARLSEHKIRHPNMEVLLEINYTPNSMNLWTRVKEQLAPGRRNKIKYDRNKFNLSRRYSEQELLADIQRIHDERFKSD